MKTKVLATAVAVLVSIIAAGACRAQSGSLEVTVPFAFEPETRQCQRGAIVLSPCELALGPSKYFVTQAVTCG
jgi:hypothetical protein